MRYPTACNAYSMALLPSRAAACSGRRTQPKHLKPGSYSALRRMRAPWHAACPWSSHCPQGGRAMRKHRSASSKPIANGVDAIELLKEDHRRIESMFREFVDLRGTDPDGESKRAVVERACAALTVHTRIEEE